MRHKLKTSINLFKSALLVITVLCFSVSNVGADALTGTVNSNDTNSIIQQTPFYDPNAQNTACTSANGAATPAGGSTTITGTGAWNANVQQPYYLEQFIINVLQDVAQVAGVPTSDTVTQEHVIAMTAWAYGEGGNIANTGYFNLWNTGIDNPALIAGKASGDGVQAFVSFDAGVTAATETITGSLQNRLEQVLTQPNTTAAQFVQALTYYQNYPGNTFWAEADKANQQQYFNTYTSLVAQTRANYAQMASVEIGVGQEGKNHVPASQLMFAGGTASPTPATGTMVPTVTSSGCTATVAATSADCAQGTQVTTGNAAIACDVLKYASIMYSQAGHKLPSVWHQECPTIGPSCATDCSGLVSIAVFDVYGLDDIWTTFSMLSDAKQNPPQNWEVIQLSQVQPGDVVEPNPDHVEVIESVQGNTLQDFGAHSENSRPEVGADTMTAQPGFVYLRYIGQGAGGSSVQ